MFTRRLTVAFASVLVAYVALYAQEGHKHQREFSEGLAAVGFDRPDTKHACDGCELKLNWGFADKTGKIVIGPNFAAARDFSDGLAAVQNFRGKWGYIDRNGRDVSGFRFDYAYSFSEHLAVVRVGHKYGYIDSKGAFAIPLTFTEAHEFREGLALVRFGGITRGEVSLDLGTELTKPVREYDEDDELGGRFAFIERTGKVRIKAPRGFEPGEFSSEELVSFTTTKKDGALYCGYLDIAGKVAIQPEYGICEPFRGGTANVLLDGKWHRLDKHGSFVKE